MGEVIDGTGGDVYYFNLGIRNELGNVFISPTLILTGYIVAPCFINVTNSYDLKHLLLAFELFTMHSPTGPPKAGNTEFYRLYCHLRMPLLAEVAPARFGFPPSHVCNFN